jgi:hypothetical protein
MSLNLQLAQKIVKQLRKGWPKPIRYLAGGANGKVYETDDGRVIKFIANKTPAEFQALRNLQGTFIVPRHGPSNSTMFKLGAAKNKIHNVMFPRMNNSPNNMTIILMGKVGGNKSMTLSNYITTYPKANKENIQRRVQYLIEQMHLKGWAHGNLHSGNIIVSVTPTGRISGMWVVDFGRAYRINNNKTEREAFMNLKSDPNYKMYSTGALFPPGKGGNVPIRGSPLRRANVHMMNIHYGKRIEPVQEQKWRNLRKFAVNEVAKYLRSPKKRLSTPRSARTTPRSAPKSRRPQSAPK